MKISLLTPQPMQLPKLTIGDGEKFNKEGFGQVLTDALNKVNDLSKHSDDLTKKMITGEVTDIHQVTIAAEQASVALNLTVQVRNKIVEAYQEIARMQV